MDDPPHLMGVDHHMAVVCKTAPFLVIRSMQGPVISTGPVACTEFPMLETLIALAMLIKAVVMAWLNA